MLIKQCVKRSVYIYALCLASVKLAIFVSKYDVGRFSFIEL